MRQTGEDMDLGSIFAAYSCREDCGDHFQVSADSQRDQGKTSWCKGHETRPVLDRWSDA